MESMVDLRLQSVKIAATMKDVNSECVIDVAEKIVRYVKGDASIPETYDPTAEARKMVEGMMNKFNADKPSPLPPLGRCY